MSLRDSIESIWDVALSNSLVDNVAKILNPKLRETDGGLMPEFYGTTIKKLYRRREDFALYQLRRCDREKHIVTHIDILENQHETYFLKTGLITLQDKLVCSFLGWPLTLLEALFYLLAAPTALAAVVLLTVICILGAIPYLLSNNGNVSHYDRRDLGILYAFLIMMAPVSLVMAAYRLFQAVFRIPVGIALLIKAGINKIYGVEGEPLKTVQTLMDKTPEQIRELGIDVVDNRPVHQHHPVVHPDSAVDIENDINNDSDSDSGNEISNDSDNDNDSESDNDQARLHPPLFSSNPPIEDSDPSLEDIEIPERYKCSISLDLMNKPILLSDGYFYDENEIWKIPNPSKSPNTNEKLTNGHYLEVLSFAKELKAFAEAIKAEHEQSEPNYQPILDLAKKAEETAGEIREQITLWIQTYKTQAGLISETAKDENNYACISKALAISLILHPESRKDVGKDVGTSKALQEAILQKFQSNQTEMISWFLSLCCEPKAPNGMKECLIKALQEAMMEAHNFPEKFAALATERAATNTFSSLF